VVRVGCRAGAEFVEDGNSVEELVWVCLGKRARKGDELTCLGTSLAVCV
jgi:hypothetical protein